jgi:teichuronic acid exporter
MPIKRARMPHNDLRANTVSAISWSFVDSAANRALSVVIAIYLARLLDPSAFGLVAMLAVVIALASLVVDGGFTVALIQKKTVSQQDANTVFYINMATGAAISALLLIAAPAIAAFYQQPVLKDVTRALSALFVLYGISAVQMAQLIRGLRFGRLAAIGITSMVLSGAIAILMAHLGHGVWSLVVQQISQAAFRAVGFWVLGTWRPTTEFSTDSLRALFSYGWKILASSTLGKLFDNLYFIVIGRSYGAFDLGQYSRADMFQRVPVETIGQVTSQVSLPVFSSIQDDRERLRQATRKALLVLVLVNFPMMAGLALTAKPLVLTLLTERWSPAAEILQILAVVGLLYPLHVLNMNILQATGRSDLFLRITVARHMLTVIVLALTWKGGIKAIALGQVAVSVLAFFVNASQALYPIRRCAWQQLKDTLPYAGTTVLMGAGTWAVGNLSYPAPLWQLCAQVLTGVAIYTATCAALRLEAFMEAVAEVTARLGKMTGSRHPGD